MCPTLLTLVFGHGLNACLYFPSIKELMSWKENHVFLNFLHGFPRWNRCQLLRLAMFHWRMQSNLWSNSTIPFLQNQILILGLKNDIKKYYQSAFFETSPYHKWQQPAYFSLFVALFSFHFIFTIYFLFWVCLTTYCLWWCLVGKFTWYCIKAFHS